MAKDYEDDLSLFEELMEELDDEEADVAATAIKGDEVSLLRPQQMMQVGGGGSGFGQFVKTAVPIALKAFGLEEGGQIKKKTKKKKKRYVRGCGAAKRGFGKATYSKKMY